MVIHLVVIALFLLGFIFGQKQKYKGDPLNKIAHLIAALLQKGIKKTKANKRIKGDFKVLFPNTSLDKKVMEFWVNSIKTVLVILFIGNLLGLSIQMLSQRNTIIDSGFLKRNAYGEGEKTETVLAKIDGEREEKSIEVTLSEQQYSEPEIRQIFQESKKDLERQFLGRNESLNRINQKVNLIKTIKKGIIDVEWEIIPFGLIDYSGKIVKQGISERGELAKVTAHLQYFEFQEYYSFYIQVFPPKTALSSNVVEKLRNQIEEKEKESRTESGIELPEYIDNQKIVWRDAEQFINIWLLVLAVVIGIGLFFKKKRDIKDQIKEREQQMLMDYSKVISKLLLLIGAGMPVSQAWIKIALDYKKKRKEGKISFRYVYEEMLLTYYEISDGVPEMEAFERFGRRCKVQKYLKLSGILLQNIRQGTKEIKRLLLFEMQHSLEERKSIARKMGEEAGTKLLGPMMMLLIVVLTIVAVPAFWAL